VIKAVRIGGIALGGLALAVIVIAGCLALWVGVATRAGVAELGGRQTGLRLDAPVTIARDARGVAHVRAASEHDLFFAQGYAMASDRLFQMDLTRRFTEGRIAELLGPPLVKIDEQMRSYDIERLASVQYARVPRAERTVLAAFADGVNAAAVREPLPPEYRVLFTRFRAWRPQDSIEVGYATLLDLDDDAAWIVARDWIHRHLGAAGSDFFLPLTDPAYDMPVNGDKPGPIARLPDLPARISLRRDPRALDRAPADDRAPLGSNGWVVGANRTSVHRAILANDPHLSLGVPGVWWLFEGRSPGLHIAGATLAGTLGVTLGHNEHVAWGVTAGETSAMRLIREPFRAPDEFYEHGRWLRAAHDRQTIQVRFAGAQTDDVLRTPNGTIIGFDGTDAYLRDWLAARSNEDIFRPYLALSRSTGIAQALAAMRQSTEPALNLIVADDTGRAAYHLVGGVPRDAAWGRWAVDGNAPEAAPIPFDEAPHVDASRDALVVTSNNRSAGAGSPRLAPYWPPPYRAFAIAHALATAAAGARGGLLTPQAVGAPQHEDRSPAEAELARRVVAAVDRLHAGSDPAIAAAVADLRAFDGSMIPASRAATVVSALRPIMYAQLTAAFPPDIAQQYIGSSASLAVPLRALRERPRGWVADWDEFALAALRAAVARVGTPVPTFGQWAAQPLAHPLARFGLAGWNGPTMTGRGGAYAPAVQNNGHGQSFRAEWIVGDWDAGTIDIDAGESGEPGAPHYRDQTAGWERFARTPLPFSDAAVAAATATTLTLAP
jgi:penicillin amidase